jgi:hypothetical protein
MAGGLKELGGGDLRVEELAAWVSSAQNSDGGWSYGCGPSSTEPTAYAVLALIAAKSEPAAINRGIRWLKGTHRADGGWAPRSGIDYTTWTTALGLVTLVRAGAITGFDPSVEWLLAQSGAESGLVFRLRQRLLGDSSGYSTEKPGWPWFPGAAAWVVPTAVSILGLQAVRKICPGARLDRRLREGEAFLISRICRDGGWNHGSSRALGYESDSYPETTGVALLALRTNTSPIVQRASQCAKEHLQTCRSRLGVAWLQLGLLAAGSHAREVEALSSAALYPFREFSDVALTIMARAAFAGRNIWVE